ncbi:MAG: TPM domain-containing protein [Gemmatimonadaceae bacterium]|nr:TPM domain-containing protein [Gemmatimonadaceae bacterium]
MHPPVRALVGGLGIAAALLTGGVGAGAQPSGIRVPPPTGYVNDFAGVLGGSVPRLDAITQEIKQKSGGELAIVTLSDIGNYAASDVAREIGRQWKVGALTQIGDRTRNTGVVILVVPKESNASGRGACRIETGQGSEGFITDADAGTICREATAFFRTRDYASGTQLIAERVANEFAREFGFTFEGGSGIRAPVTAQRPAQRGGQLSPFALFLIFVVIMVIVSAASRGGRGRRGGGVVPVILPGPGWGGGGWSGGGGSWGGGGFGGFGGGGGFSGGGGGSDW